MIKLLKSKFILGALIVAGLAVATTASAAYTHTVTLKMGSRNAQVLSLQQNLNLTTCKVSVTGAGAPGLETTYFGAKTLSAVKCFQASNGLTADGIVGPITGARLAVVSSGSMTGNFPAGCTSASGYSTTTGLPCNSGPSTGLPAGCSSTAGYSPLTGKKCDSSTTPTTGGPLSGGAGDITISALSDFGDEEVGEGDEDVEVLAFEVEADDSSDVEITSVKVELSQENTADSEDLTDYAESVSIMMNGKVVGSADAEDFSENNDIWTKSISLDGAIVRSGDTEEFSVAVTSLANLDSGDIDSDDWQVGVSSVRFVDGEGVVTTDSLTLDIGDNVLDDTLEEQFSFSSFASASDVELEVSLTDGEEEVNEAHVINIDDTDDTDDVKVLAFTLEADGSDINVSEIPVLFTTTETTGNDPDDLMSTARLWMDDDVIATESFLTSDADGSTETITFDDLDIDVEDGDSVDLVVTVDVQDTGSTLDAGDTIMADLTSTEVDAIEAEDESGEELAAADLVGTANGEASEVRDIGFNLDITSITESKTAGDPGTVGSTDRGTYVFKYTITAFDGNVSIDKSCVEDQVDAADQGTEYTATGESSDSCTVTSTADTNGADSDAWIVEDGETESFTLTVTATGADAFVSTYMTSINWDDDTTDTSPDLFSTFGLGQDDTQSGSLFLETY